MADEGNPKELQLHHEEALHFRSVFANGAVFTGPTDSSKTWLLTFYSEGVKVTSETLIPAEGEGAYRHSSPPKVDVQRIRRDEVCVIIPEGQLKSMLSAIGAAMKGEEQ